MRIAINGMGRIGRLLFRRLVGRPDIEVVAINDIMPADNLVYLLKHDSIYGRFDMPMHIESGSLICGPHVVKIFSEPDPSRLPWADLQVDTILECSGKFSSFAKASQHISAGARRVLLSTTGADDVPLMIYGLNEAALKDSTIIVSPGGCMTNCSVNVLQVLEEIGIESVQINVLHSYTSRQELVDAPHPQFRRGRAAAESIIPVEIDLHQSLERMLPSLKGKIAAVSTRVPVSNGAMADFTVQMKEKVDRDQINELFRAAAKGYLKGVLDYSEEGLVSLDIKGDTHSCVIDGTLTSVVGNHLKVIAWFDNEFGFTSRMIDWLGYWQPVKTM